MELLNYFGLGILFLIIGLVLAFIPQKSISGFGYKTPFAMKNLDTWNEANRFFGIISMIAGVIFIITGFLAYVNVIGTLSTNIYVVLACLALSFIFTEIHLRKIFDKMGGRK